MEIKRFVFNLVLVLVLVIGWRLWINHLETIHPAWKQSTAAPSVSATPGTAPATASTNPTTNSSVSAGGATSAPVGLTPEAVAHALPSTIGKGSVFPMVLSITPRGAGLNSVTLTDYYQTAKKVTPYVFQEPIVGLDNDTTSLATRSVTVDGQLTDLSDADWSQDSVSADSATYSSTIKQNGHALLKLTKTYHLLSRSDSGKGFEIQVHQAFANLTDKPMKVVAVFNGPTPPARENDRSDDRRYVSGHDAGDKWVDAPSTSVTELKKDKSVDLAVVDPHPLLWAGACNSYFQAIYRPDYAGVTATPEIKIATAQATGLDPSTLSSGAMPTTLQITTSEFTLPAGHEIPLDAHVYFGPKIRQLLKGDYYASFPRSYEKNLVYTGGWCGFLTFNWLINILYGILAFFHMIFRDWGLAIIGLVCLVRLLLHPITKRSQITMLEMSKKSPEIERLKKKYADNKEELNKAMMQVMNPAQQLMGCLPMFLQTPIWIALWNALQSTFELRQAGFLRWQHLHLTWISDLSHPDALINFAPITLPFVGWQVSQINILPVLVGCVSYVQQALVPAPANMTPEQEQQRKMQKFMLLLFPIMLYAGPSGLNLYILTSSTIGMIESKIIRDHIKQKEEAEKSGQLIVDAPPTRGGKRRNDDDFGNGVRKGKPSAPTKPGKLAGWIAEMQAKAEEVRRDQQRRAKNRG